MIQIGCINKLKITTIDDEGAWFEDEQLRILLPAREVPGSAAPGDELTVFVFINTAGLPVATLKRPRAQVGEFAQLQVSDVTKHGAFLDWGLDKELLVPYSEQPERMRKGHRYLVKVCLDDRNRVVATARVEKCLEEPPGDLKVNDEVEVLLWDFTDLGVKVIINDLYPALLYRDELRPGMKRGQRFQAYVQNIRDDGKIDVTLRRSGAAGVVDARDRILEALQPEGFLPLHDQSSPEEIFQVLEMSKKVFKKAVGGLYKEGHIELVRDGIRLKDRSAT